MVSLSPLLDHIVILIPYSFLTAPPPWFSHLFYFSPGGRHVGGQTENILVLMRDGSYLEFIAFVPPADSFSSSPATVTNEDPTSTELDRPRRDDHRWGHCSEGTVVDWALTLHGDADAGADDDDGNETGEGKRGGRRSETEEIKHAAQFRAIQSRVRDARAGIEYGDLAAGGRRRPDGAELRWGISSAFYISPAPPRSPADPRHGTPVQPSRVPFWCLDDTPRELRVPYADGPGAVATTHPTGVVGVAAVEVVLPGGKGEGKNAGAEAEEGRAAVRGVFDAVFGRGPGEGGGGDGDEWTVRTLAGEGVHGRSRVKLSTAGGQSGLEPGVRITFYTEDESWAGKTIGGKVDEGHTIEFKLVAAFPDT